MFDYIEQFCIAIKQAGIIPPARIIPDGKIHRFSSNGKHGDQAGWYRLHADEIPAGCFGDWRTGVNQSWRADIGRPLTHTEDNSYREKVNLMRREYEAEAVLSREKAQAKANYIWKKAQQVDNDYPYLINKRIKSHGTKIYKGILVIPLWDEKRTIHSIQFIAVDGKKRFLSGGRVAGCYFSIGSIKNAKAVCITEGFGTGSTVYEASNYPVAVAFHAGNLLAVARIMREKFPELSIIICPDDDHLTDGNPGLTKAREAALAVGGLLAIPIFESDRPDDATDLNDMSKLYGIASVRKIISNAVDPVNVSKNQSNENKYDEWPEPQPLIADQIPREPYPLEALPETIRAAVLEVQNFTKAPIPLVAASALGAISLAGQTYVDIKRAENLCGPTSLFLINIADSGERKSTCDGYFTRALCNYEKESAENAKPLIYTYQGELEAWKSEVDGVKLKIKSQSGQGHDITDLRNRLIILESEKPQFIKVPRLIYGDVTPEALKHNMIEVWPSVGVISSEGGVVFGAHGMKKDSIMSNLATYNQGWDGKSIPTDRRTTTSLGTQEVRLTMAIQVQEATLKDFTSRLGTLARGTGYFARVLFSWPESTQGSRFFTEPPETWPYLDKFNKRITDILMQKSSIHEDGILKPKLLSLAPLAKLAWVRFHDGIEAELHSSGELYDVRDVASKAADNAARLAALFHLIEYGSDGDVEEDSFDGASLIVLWHLNESRRFFGELALPTELANAACLEEWLFAYCQRNQVNHVPTQIVAQFGPKGLRKIATIKSIVSELQRLGRARLNTDKKPNTIEINPALLNGDTKK